MVSPVTYDAWSDDKKATQFDTSSPVPSLPIGILEVKNAFSNNLSTDLQSLKAIGITYFFDCLKGKISLEEAIKKTKQESRRYAKRQMTWFKNSFISDLLHCNLYIDNDELVDTAIKYI